MSGGTPSAPARVGVLFIHGIGEQRRGETLSAFGAPVYQWFRRWLGADSVALRDSLLETDPAQPQAPAHTRLVISSRNAGAASLLMAECCWAESFPMPSFRDVARWALIMLPWTTTTQFGIRWRYLLQSRSGRLLSYPQILVEGTIHLGSFFVSAAAQVVVLALLVLGLIPIPALRDFLFGLQLKIAAIAGDSYVLLQNPIKADAIVQRVVRDLNWLRDQGCNRIALVAHSQGGAIAHEVLASHRSGQSGQAMSAVDLVRLYFSVGSGLGRLHDLRGAEAGWWQVPAGWLVMLSLIGLAITAPPTFHRMFTDPLYYAGAQPDWAGAVVWAAGMVALGVVGLLTEWCLDRRKQLRLRGVAAHAGSIPGDATRWVDRYASRDPVPAGPLLPEGVSGGPDSGAVYNRHSILADHTSYWRGQDGVVTDVARQLAELAGIQLPAPAVLDEASLRRRWRVHWLAAVRLLALAGAPFALWALHRVGLLSFSPQQIAAARRPFALVVDPDQEGLGQWIWKLAETPVLAGAVVLLGLLLWYLAAGRVWHAWDRREAGRFFAQEPMRIGLPWIAAHVLLVLAPSGLAGALMWSGGVGPLLQWLPELPRLGRAQEVALALSCAMGFLAGLFGLAMAYAFEWNAHRRWYCHPIALGVAGWLSVCAALVLALRPVARLAPELLLGGTGRLGRDTLAGLGLAILFCLVWGLYVWLLLEMLRRYAPRGGRARPQPSQLTERLLEPWDTRQEPLTLGLVAVACSALAILLSERIYHGWHSLPAAGLVLLVVSISLLSGWNARQEQGSSARRLGLLSLVLLGAALLVPSIFHHYVDS